jgi:hypothetical protein
MPPIQAPGFLSQAGSFLQQNPMAGLMGGQALSGLAQAKMQAESAQRALNASQLGNVEWTEPNQVAQLDAAAAAPITVPQGYLARAAAARNLMNGSSNQTAPLQSSPTAPPPAAPTVAPLATASNPVPGQAGGVPGASGANPVPIYGMAATPRGGTI